MTEPLLSQAKLCNTEPQLKRGIRHLFLREKKTNHRTICALQRQGILRRGAFERNVRKTEPLPLSMSQNKPYHRHLKVILDKDRG